MMEFWQFIGHTWTVIIFAWLALCVGGSLYAWASATRSSGVIRYRRVIEDDEDEDDFDDDEVDDWQPTGSGGLNVSGGHLGGPLHKN